VLWLAAIRQIISYLEYLLRMRRPEEQREHADSALLELALSDIFDSVAAGRSVPLSRDGKVVAAVVSPEVAEAGQRALDR
jgi:hypothetical protein